jgi:hypothetical protein
MKEWQTIFAEVQDFLIPKLDLDAYERSIYQYLLRHTRLLGAKDAVFSIDGMAQGTGFSSDKVRKAIRSMSGKGCIAIEDRSRKGHVIRVHLPAEINGVVPAEPTTTHTDIEAVDFFTGRKYLQPLLRREGGTCFYCLRAITEDGCALDHVVPQVAGGDNSYRNIAVACHECNAGKQETPPADFLRALYRDGLLSKEDLQARLEALADLQAGNRKPSLT